MLTIGLPAASDIVNFPVQFDDVAQDSADQAALAATPLSVTVVPLLLPNVIAYVLTPSASTFVPLSVSTAKLCTAGTVSAADHMIEHEDDVHDVALPAGAVAPSMNTAARVVAGDT